MARILVVDDQRTNAEMVSGVLRNLGYDVEIALDAQSALDTVRNSTAARAGFLSSGIRKAAPAT